MDRKLSKKVAIFLPDLEGAGAQRVLLNLAVGIAGRGIKVDLVLVQARGAYAKDLPPQISVVDLAAPRILGSLIRFVAYLRSHRPNSVLTGPTTINLIAIWARKLSRVPCRLVITQHSTLSIDTKSGDNWRHRQLSRLARLSYKSADAIVSVSNGVAADLVDTAAVPSERIQTIYNPVITPELREKARENSNHPWFASAQPPVVLSVGRLTKAKNYEMLIKAFAQVRAKTNARLLILGEGEQRAKLEELARKLNIDKDVCLPGFVENPYSYMTASSIFVLSSDWEGLPTVLIEALYCGAQVISTDCPSGPREILADGTYGDLVKSGDTQGLADTMTKALLGSRTRSWPEFPWQTFELQNIVDQYVDTLRL